MSGQLQSYDDDGGFVRCSSCGALAAGPCARCRTPLCGDCCVISEGGATPWALCRACARGGGTSLQRGWLLVLGWIAKPILLLLGAYLLLRWLF